MTYKAINLEQKLTLITEHWSPKIIAQLNDYDLKIVKVQGEFVWHSHPETDEVFLVLAGTMDIQMREGSVTLNRGELFVVPKGVEHRPAAGEECHILLIEPAGTVNTGDAGGERTAAADWLA